MMKLLCLAFFFALGALPARADRDIVYAARYYAPPSSHRTSHFHLYRINPDGTGRTQLTFGPTDDDAPLWSPDGRQILFQRDSTAQYSSAPPLYIVAANGGPARPLVPPPPRGYPGESPLVTISLPSGAEEWGLYRWLPDGRTVAVLCTYSNGMATMNEIVLFDSRTGVRHTIAGATDYRPSSDGRRAYLPGDTADRLWEQAGNTLTPITDPVQSAVWMDAQTLIGLAGDPEKNGYFLRVLRTDGHERSHLPIHLPDSVPNLDGAPHEDFALLKTTPDPKRQLVYALNNHNSTVGANWVYLTLNPVNGTTQYLAEGRFLSWSPEGLRFCIAPGREAMPYERMKDGRERTVWAAPLQVGSTGNHQLKNITRGLVWVTWADWRQQLQKSSVRTR